MRPNRTKAKLNAGQTVYGCHVRYADTDLLEYLSYYPFDFVVVDGEHGTIEPRDCANLVRAAELHDVTPIVRVTTNQPWIMLRYMDTGAHGAQVPWVNSGADAEAAVRAVKYFPRGRRGLAGTRAADFGHTRPLAEYVKVADDETLVVFQVESKDAVDQIEQIALVDGVDVILIGLMDLSQTLGVTGQMNHPLLESAVARIIEAVSSSSAKLGVMVDDAAGARIWRERGASWIVISLEALLRPAVNEYLSALGILK